jgi:O-antigen/teichoic acid export membrane protein
MTIERVSGAMYWSVIAKVTRFSAGIVANILIVRSLGPTDWGMYSVIKSLFAFASTIVMLGTGNAILRFIPLIRVRGGIGSFIATLKRLIFVQISVWAVLISVVYLVGDRFRMLFGGRFEGLDRYLLFAVGFVLFEVFLGVVTSVVQSWYETKWYANVTLIGNVLYLSCLIYFLKTGAGIIGILVSGAIVNVAMSLLLLPQAGRLISSEGDSSGEDANLGKVLRFSLPFVATGLLNLIVWRQSEVLFLGAFHGETAAGYFGLAYTMPQLLLEFVPLTIWPIVMAGMSEAYARDPVRLPDAIGLYYRLLYVLVIPVAAFGFAFARPLVPVIYGNEMMPAALFAQLFFVVFSYSFLYTPLSMALYITGKSWVNMLVFAFLALVNIGLDLALIPRYGLWGAFLPVALVMILGVAIFYIVASRIVQNVFIPVSFIVRCYLAALPTAALALTSMRWGGPVALPVQIVAGAVLLIACFRFLRVLGPQERELIARLPVPFKGVILKLL